MTPLEVVVATISHASHGTSIFTYMNDGFLWQMMVNVGKSTIHGCYGI